MMLANLSAVEACVLRLEDVAIQESTLMAPPRISTDFDFLDPDVNLAGLTVAELAELRESEPIHWVDVSDGCGCFEDNGYWLLTDQPDQCAVLPAVRLPGHRRAGASWPRTGDNEHVARGPIVTHVGGGHVLRTTFVSESAECPAQTTPSACADHAYSAHHRPTEDESF
jgi:hypothetical protein